MDQARFKSIYFGSSILMRVNKRMYVQLNGDDSESDHSKEFWVAKSSFYNAWRRVLERRLKPKPYPFLKPKPSRMRKKVTTEPSQRISPIPVIAMIFS